MYRGERETRKKEIIRRVNAMSSPRPEVRPIYLASLHLEIANKDCKHSYRELLLGDSFLIEVFISRSREFHRRKT